ncbi:MAG TPA: hypothetical protein VKB93_13245 [Thermoanaerobaculia bacterium]|nr:hypothetical protein [Thermoanaerobaculia bacterium]
MSSNSMYTPRDAQHMQSFGLWFMAAIAAFVVMTVLLERQAIAGALAWGLTAATVLLLVMMIRAYIIFLRGADELLRKVQLEALAVSFGATIVFMLGWRLCERLGAPKLDVNDPLIVMSAVFAIAQLIGHRRYAETP